MRTVGTGKGTACCLQLCIYPQLFVGAKYKHTSAYALAKNKSLPTQAGWEFSIHRKSNLIKKKNGKKKEELSLGQKREFCLNHSIFFSFSFNRKSAFS